MRDPCPPGSDDSDDLVRRIVRAMTIHPVPGSGALRRVHGNLGSPPAIDRVHDRPDTRFRERRGRVEEWRASALRKNLGRRGRRRRAAKEGHGQRDERSESRCRVPAAALDVWPVRNLKSRRAPRRTPSGSPSSNRGTPANPRVRSPRGGNSRCRRCRGPLLCGSSTRQGCRRRWR